MFEFWGEQSAETRHNSYCLPVTVDIIILSVRVSVLSTEYRFSLNFISLSVVDPVFFCLSLTEDSLMAQTVKCLPAMQKTWIQSLCWEDLLEKEMATHSSILAWRIPWTEEPSRLYSPWSSKTSSQLLFHFQQRIKGFLGLPGGPVVKTRYPHCRGRGFHPWAEGRPCARECRQNKQTFTAGSLGWRHLPHCFSLSFFLLYHGFPFFLLNIAVHSNFKILFYLALIRVYSREIFQIFLISVLLN